MVLTIIAIFFYVGAWASCYDSVMQMVGVTCGYLFIGWSIFQMWKNWGAVDLRSLRSVHLTPQLFVGGDEYKKQFFSNDGIGHWLPLVYGVAATFVLAGGYILCVQISRSDDSLDPFRTFEEFLCVFCYFIIAVVSMILTNIVVASAWFRYDLTIDFITHFLLRRESPIYFDKDCYFEDTVIKNMFYTKNRDLHAVEYYLLANPFLGATWFYLALSCGLSGILGVIAWAVLTYAEGGESVRLMCILAMCSGFHTILHFLGLLMKFQRMGKYVEKEAGRSLRDLSEGENSKLVKPVNARFTPEELMSEDALNKIFRTKDGDIHMLMFKEIPLGMLGTLPVITCKIGLGLVGITEAVEIFCFVKLMLMNA